VARQVAWTEIALSDLGSIAEFIGRDSEQRVVPEFGDGNIRELIIRSDRLIYRVQRNEVAILGLIHGARDLANLPPAKK
jgi:plasmid stabilization system protein ParE